MDKRASVSSSVLPLRPFVRIAAVVLLSVILVIPSRAAPYRLLLDNDVDNDPATIQREVIDYAVITVYLEIGDEIDPRGAAYEFGTRMLTCSGDPSDGFDECDLTVLPAWNDHSEDWCNPDIHVKCDWGQGVGLDCEPPLPGGWLKPGLDLKPGDRIVLGKVLVGFPSCQVSPSPFWMTGYFGDHDIALVSDTLSVDRSNPVNHVTWGLIKETFRP